MATLSWLLLFTLVFWNKYSFMTTLSVFLFAGILLLLKWDELAQTGGKLSALIDELDRVALFIRGYLPYEEKYGMIICVAVSAFMVFYMVLAVYVTFQFYFVALLGFGTFAVNWLMNYRRSEMGFAIFLFCFMALAVRKMNKKRQNKSLITLLMLPVCLAIVASASIIPSGSSPLGGAKSQDAFKSPLAAATDFFYFMFNPKYFTFQTTGFEGPSGRLGGSIALNNRKVMEVYTDRPTYLSGRIKDTYTSSSWENKDGEFTLAYNRDLARRELFETRLSLPYSPDGTFEPFAEMVALTVQIGSARTGTIFRPAKSMEVSIDTSLAMTVNDMGDIRMSDVLPANTSYTFSYLDVDYSSPGVQEILRQSRRGIYREAVQNGLYLDEYLNGPARAFYSWEGEAAPITDLRDIWANWEIVYTIASAQGNPSVRPSAYFENVLAPYADYAYANFLDIPDTVPERVRSLARELTKDLDYGYDKAKAIESYLASFPYTLTPGQTPREADFVDYFLFEGKEGYCVYYASAMAILCRSIGLPARYLEGYILPSSSSRNGVYSVTNLQAHSWVEVYFEGFGWVPFEPTAPYSFGFSGSSSLPSSGIFAPEFAQDPDYYDYIEDIMGESAHRFMPPTQTAPAAAEDAGPSTKGAFQAALAALAAILLALATVALRGKAVISAKERRISSMPPNKQASEIFKSILGMAAYWNYPIASGETPEIYAQRVGKRFSFSSDNVHFSDLAEIYYRARYSSEGIKKSELELIRNSRQEFLGMIKGVKPGLPYFWDRYVRRRF
jgi:transglutaminase-like putative cysteine protease